MLAAALTVSQLSNVIAQVMAPAFLLAALAASANDAARSRLKTDIPRSLRRSTIINRAVLWAVISSIAITMIMIVAFVSAQLHIEHERGVAVLFITSLAAFTLSLVDFAREIRIALSEFDHYG